MPERARQFRPTRTTRPLKTFTAAPLSGRTDRRPSPTRRGYGRAWQKLRATFLAYYPLCHDCLNRGIATVATEVHHLRKHHGAAELLFDWNNLLALCKSCHSRRTARGE